MSKLTSKETPKKALNNRQGGSYRKDPGTGELTLINQTKSKTKALQKDAK